eukprot:1162111-Pelagomonas_calceolata.AAC.1
MLLTGSADLGIGASEQHIMMFFILYVIRITGITDWRSTIGPSSLFNSESVYPQPESGNVAKDTMGKIQIHVFRHCKGRMNCVCTSDRKCAPLMICQPFTVAYHGIRSCEFIQVATSLTATTQRTVQTTPSCRDYHPHNPPGCGWDYLHCPYP